VVVRLPKFSPARRSQPPRVHGVNECATTRGRRRERRDAQTQQPPPHKPVRAPSWRRRVGGVLGACRPSAGAAQCGRARVCRPDGARVARGGSGGGASAVVQSRPQDAVAAAASTVDERNAPHPPPLKPLQQKQQRSLQEALALALGRPKGNSTPVCTRHLFLSVSQTCFRPVAASLSAQCSSSVHLMPLHLPSTHT